MTTKTAERANGTAVEPPPETGKPSIFDALTAVMGEVQAVGKGDRNTQQNYAFRGIDAVVNAVGPALRKHGVIVIPTLVDAAYRDVQTSTGKPSRECTVRVRYTFYGPDGSHIDAVVPGESMDFGDKGAPKAMSVAFRIALLQALAIPTHESDPDAQSYEREHGGSEWAGAKPAQREQATAEQTALFDEYAKRIAAAENREALPPIWEAAKADFGDGRLIAKHGNELRTAIADRSRELSGSPI